VRAALERRPYLAALAVWAAWLGGVLATLAIGVATGAIADPHHAWFHYGGFLWPLFSWDFGWYHSIALRGYPAGHGGREYAFFPLWPLLLSWAGPIAVWVAGLVLSLVSSAGAFLAVGAANPRRRAWQSAVALACFPGSFALLLAYPDALALAAAAGATALAMRGRPIPAALLAAVAAAARPNAFLIVIPLAAIARGRSRIYWLAVAAPIAAAAAVHGYFWSRSGVWDPFLRAQSQWHRGGPGTFRTWASHVSHALEHHAAIVIPLALAGAAVLIILLRSRSLYGLWVAYALVVAALLAGTQSTRTLTESARAAVVLPLCLLLWRFGREYRPWALFATGVVALSLASGTIQSFGRQALFAFPILWAASDGPRFLRRPPVIALAIAANVALTLTISRWPP
jgi:hypothetical protein